ncbi:hypothetical protein H2248_008798 [Termitomyces sp. 'cryptogamus']|nr:hypothetical protein H2248_008798 [Termitomyces sp. 'cryptogamus']
MLTPELFQQWMRKHIADIRDFCCGLEYQLQFNDHKLLEVLESEGSQFLKLVHQCLESEGRLRNPEEQDESPIMESTTRQPNEAIAHTIRDESLEWQTASASDVDLHTEKDDSSTEDESHVFTSGNGRPAVPSPLRPADDVVDLTQERNRKSGHAS